MVMTNNETIMQRECQVEMVRPRIILVDECSNHSHIILMFLSRAGVCHLTGTEPVAIHTKTSTTDGQSTRLRSRSKLFQILSQSTCHANLNNRVKTKLTLKPVEPG